MDVLFADDFDPQQPDEEEVPPSPPHNRPGMRALVNELDEVRRRGREYQMIDAARRTEPVPVVPQQVNKVHITNPPLSSLHILLALLTKKHPFTCFNCPKRYIHQAKPLTYQLHPTRQCTAKKMRRRVRGIPTSEEREDEIGMETRGMKARLLSLHRRRKRFGICC